MLSDTAISGLWKVVVQDYQGAPNDRDIRATLYYNNKAYRTYSVTTSDYDEYWPRVAINSSGNFAVTYMYRDGDIDLAVRAYRPTSSVPWLNTQVARTTANEILEQAKPIAIGSQNHIFVAYTFQAPNAGINTDIKVWRSTGNVTRTVANTSVGERQGQVLSWAVNGSWADVAYYTTTSQSRFVRRITF